MCNTSSKLHAVLSRLLCVLQWVHTFWGSENPNIVSSLSWRAVALVLTVTIKWRFFSDWSLSEQRPPAPLVLLLWSIFAKMMLSLQFLKAEAFFGMSVRITYCPNHLLLFQDCDCICITDRLPGKLWCWPNCSLCNILTQKLLCSVIQKYLCWQGNSSSASISKFCSEKSHFVLVQHARFNSSVVLIIEAVTLKSVVLFTTFRVLCARLGEKSAFPSSLTWLENHLFCDILRNMLLVSLLRLLLLTVLCGRSVLAATGIHFGLCILLSPLLWQPYIFVNLVYFLI